MTRPDHDPDVCTLADMLNTGATYRQLDFWVRAGLLDNPDLIRPGTGYARRWTWSDRERLTHMLRFVRAGVLPRVAAEWARRTGVDPDRPNTVVTDDGLTITWEDPP